MELRERGFNVEGLLCDVTDQGQVQAVVDKTLDAFGKVDILVDNAGVSWGERPERMPLDKWRKVLDANLTGAFLFAQAAGREMLKREYGRIINVSSVSGLRASADGPHYVGYAASKAGLFGLTREPASTRGRRGIRVNAVAPGFFPSRLTEGDIERAEGSIKARSPIPRVGREGELRASRSSSRPTRRTTSRVRPSSWTAGARLFEEGNDEQSGSGQGDGRRGGRVGVRGAAVA